MAKSNPLISSLNSGEFSPRMEARVDLDRYPSAARVCRNMLCLPQGGLTRRPGTRFIKEVKDFSADTKILPFIFSQDSAVIVEHGNNYARFYQQQARIDAPDISTVITNGTFAANITSWNDPVNSATILSSQSLEVTVDGTSFTFSSVSVPNARANRQIVVGVAAIRTTSSSSSINTVTWNGSSMLQVDIADTDTSNYELECGRYRIGDDFSLTGDIVVTILDLFTDCWICVFEITCPNAIDTDNNADDTISGAGVLSQSSTISTSGVGLGFAAVINETANVTGFGWANLTELSDNDLEGNQRASMASSTTAGTPTITATRSGGGGGDEEGVMMLAAFGPTVAGIGWTATGGGRLQLNGLESGYSYAEQVVSVAPGDIAKLHWLKFRMQGYGGAKFDFRVGTTTGGAEIMTLGALDVGEHSIGFVPGATTIYVGFRQYNQPVRDMWLDNVEFIDNSAVEVVSPYATADLDTLRLFQAANVGYLMHPSYAPQRLEIVGARTSITQPFFEDGPYLEINPDTDLGAAQIVSNPFFENGLEGWTTSIAGGTTKVEVPTSSSYAIITVDAGNDDGILKQNFAVTAGARHVMHILTTGPNESTSYIKLGDTDGGTEYINTPPSPKWQSFTFIPNAATIYLQIGVANVQGGPLYVHAAVMYQAEAKLLGVSATTGEVTLTAYGHTPFASTDIGRLVRIEHPGRDAGYGVVIAYTSSSVVTLLVLRDIASTVPSETWRLGAWSDTTGWPSTVGFSDGRLIAANNTEQPQTIWASQSDDLHNMRPDSYVDGSLTVEDDDAISVTLQSKRMDTIQWIAEPGQLIVGTAGAQWPVSSTGPVITPADIGTRPKSFVPSSSEPPIESNEFLLFLDRTRREMHELAYSQEAGGFQSQLLTVLADHILRSPAQEMTYQQRPNPTLWVVREDGRLAALAYNRSHDVLGWTQHILGGSFGVGDAVVEHVAVIPGTDGSAQVNPSDERDEVWLVVKRTINSTTKRYIEVLEGEYEGPLREDYDNEQAWETAVKTDQVDAFYVDSGITYDSSPLSIIPGLNHLEGETVKVWADGLVQTDKTVSGGSITLDTAANVVQIGLPYTHKYMSLKMATGSQAGTSVGKVKAITAVGVVVLDCGTFDITTIDQDVDSGRTIHDLYTFDFRPLTTEEIVDQIRLYSGEDMKRTDAAKSTDPRIYLEGDAPVPCTILAITPIVEGSDEP